jgi:hypothetical protein
VKKVMSPTIGLGREFWGMEGMRMNWRIFPTVESRQIVRAVISPKCDFSSFLLFNYSSRNSLTGDDDGLKKGRGGGGGNVGEIGGYQRIDVNVEGILHNGKEDWREEEQEGGD